MSAHKRATVSVSEEQYRQLHEAAMRKRFLQEDLPEITRNLRAETQETMRGMIAATAERHAQYDAALHHMHHAVRTIEDQTQRALHAREAELWEALDAQAGNLWNDVTQALLDDREELYTRLEAEHEMRHAQIGHLASEIHALRAGSVEKEQAAYAWIESAQELWSLLNRQFDHRRFSPGDMDEVHAMLQQAQVNLDQAMPEAAAMMAQQAYHSCSLLRIRLEKQNTEHDLLLLAATEKCRQLIDLIRHNQVCHAIDLEGKELEQTIEVDAWTDGALAKEQDYLTNLLVQLEAHGDMVQTDMLHELLQDTFPAAYQELEDTLLQARMLVLNAQLRVNIADLVLQALQEQGYVFEHSGYEDADMRHSYYAQTQGIDGSQVIIQVEPVKGVASRSELHIHTLDASQFTHHEMRQRAREIQVSLARFGLDVGVTKTQPAEDRRLSTLFGRQHAQQVARRVPK